MTLPPLDELLDRAERRTEYGSNTSQYVFVPIDRWATQTVYDLNPNAMAYEVQTFYKSYVVSGLGYISDSIENILVPVAREIYKENPGSHLVFCYTAVESNSRSMAIPQVINASLPDITRKMVLYVNREDSDNDVSLLQRLLGVEVTSNSETEQERIKRKEREAWDQELEEFELKTKQFNERSDELLERVIAKREYDDDDYDGEKAKEVRFKNFWGSVFEAMVNGPNRD
jgi:hypothetical protein